MKTHKIDREQGVQLEDALQCVGSGWEHIVKHVYEEASKYDPKIIFVQVKEKFGRLRIYWDSPERTESESKHTLPFCDVIAHAEMVSGNTCELCGKPGKVISSGYWLMARCPEHEGHKI